MDALKSTRTESSAKHPKHFATGHQCAGTLCERGVVTINTDVPVAQAARLMRDKHIGDVIVTEKKNGKTTPIGIVTDRDLTLAAVTRTIDPEKLKIADVVPRSIAIAHEDDDLGQLIQVMKDQGVSRLPIIDDDGALVGVVTSRRIAQWLTQGLADILSIAEKQQEKEKRKIRH